MTDEVRRAVCRCVSSWRLPRTWRDEDGARRCCRCDRVRLAGGPAVGTEDVRELAELELVEAGGCDD